MLGKQRAGRHQAARGASQASSPAASSRATIWSSITQTTPSARPSTPRPSTDSEAPDHRPLGRPAAPRPRGPRPALRPRPPNHSEASAALPASAAQPLRGLDTLEPRPRPSTSRPLRVAQRPSGPPAAPCRAKFGPRPPNRCLAQLRARLPLRSGRTLAARPLNHFPAGEPPAPPCAPCRSTLAARPPNRFPGGRTAGPALRPVPGNPGRRPLCPRRAPAGPSTSRRGSGRSASRLGGAVVVGVGDVEAAGGVEGEGAGVVGFDLEVGRRGAGCRRTRRRGRRPAGMRSRGGGPTVRRRGRTGPASRTRRRRCRRRAAPRSRCRSRPRTARGRRAGRGRDRRSRGCRRSAHRLPRGHPVGGEIGELDRDRRCGRERPRIGDTVMDADGDVGGGRRTAAERAGQHEARAAEGHPAVLEGLVETQMRLSRRHLDRLREVELLGRGQRQLERAQRMRGIRRRQQRVRATAIDPNRPPQQPPIDLLGLLRRPGPRSKPLDAM